VVGCLVVENHQEVEITVGPGATFGPTAKKVDPEGVQGLLEEEGPEAGNYPASVATTWSVSFDAVAEASPAAADFLRVVGFLAPDAIPLEIFEGASELGPALAKALNEDPLALARVEKPLLDYSLVERDVEARTVSVHRMMVQAVVLDGLDEEGKKIWAERVVSALCQVFPGPKFETWPRCERLAVHVGQLVPWIDRFEMESTEVARLLNSAASYADDRANYEEAEPLYQRSLAIKEKALGPDHPEVGTTVMNLALLRQAQGCADDAVPLFHRGVSIFERALGPEHPTTVKVRGLRDSFLADHLPKPQSPG
jgi:hypothetical protein